MRLAIFLAAAAALWVEPASAAITIDRMEPTYQPSYVEFGTTQLCAGGGTCPFEMEFTFAGTEPFGHLVFAWQDTRGLHPEFIVGYDITSLTLNGIDYGAPSPAIREENGAGTQASYSGLPILSSNTLRFGGFATTTSNGSSFLSARVMLSDTAVPEPTIWAMMLFGFGAIGFAMRRRREKLTLSYA